MKLNDATWGALAIVLGAAILFHVRAFPTIPGQQYGPALFPGVVAFGLMVCGAGLVLKGLRVRRGGEGHFHFFALDPWTRSKRQVAAFVVLVGVNVAYIAVVERLGFLVTSTLYLASVFAVFRVRTRWIAPLAIAAALVIHYAFYKLLRVPLPWGVLQPLAW